jgi:GlpG protein
MSAVAVLRLPLDEDIGELVAVLRQMRIAHRVVEESGEQVLLVADAQLAGQVMQLYRQHQRGELEPARARRSLPSPGAGVLARLRTQPLTSGLLLLVVLVALFTRVGDDLSRVSWLSFVDFSRHGDYLYFIPLTQSLDNGQWWRLLTPMLLHFGVLHLAMNSLWWWELGRRIELRQGAWCLLLLALGYSLASNLAQYLWAGPGLFGGLSGVLYGLLGHCWIYQKLAPNDDYRLPSGVVGMMLIWLLICMTGIFELVQLAAIANAAHVGGLLAGCGSGILGGLLARRRR